MYFYIDIGLDDFIENSIELNELESQLSDIRWKW